MNNLCDECSKRDLCCVLCPEAELYVKQDHVGRDELPVGLPRPKPWPELLKPVNLTKRENEIVRYLGQGLTRVDICKLLDITTVNYDVVMYRLRKKWAKM